MEALKGYVYFGVQRYFIQLQKSMATSKINGNFKNQWQLQLQKSISIF
ncbi:hypothetical protein [Flavobacterium macrobrachii]|uniref:Uncharacterized protein n=1 Tax=Flavobacterium macrobrachii TaxID=591204 RepID=A0ABS2CXC5_9FLAO|nr:hypothetical protein [Flavobacterium macrobrachii]MBM6499605.1 hypothetical protein [Flavobacterium macrobrachii]